MSLKLLGMGPCLLTLLIATFVAPEAQAQVRLGGWTYNSDAAGSPYAPYTPGYDKFARQRYPWLFQNLPGHIATRSAERPHSFERMRHAEPMPSPTRRAPAPRNRSTQSRNGEAFDIFGSSAIGGGSQNPNPGATLAPLPGTAPPHVPGPQPVLPGEGGPAGGPDGFGAMRGAGAPSNVNSPLEGVPSFRDEGNAQESKLPPR